MVEICILGHYWWCYWTSIIFLVDIVVAYSFIIGLYALLFHLHNGLVMIAVVLKTLLIHFLGFLK